MLDSATKHKALVAARMRIWRSKNRERSREIGRISRAANKEKINEKARTRYASNKQKGAEKVKLQRATLRMEVISAYGGKCACCNEDNQAFLTVDHTDNDGRAHRLVVKGSAFYRWLRKNNFPRTGFQLLCWNCNAAKAIYGTCPHHADI